jgi:choline monooxygenase
VTTETTIPPAQPGEKEVLDPGLIGGGRLADGPLDRLPVGRSLLPAAAYTDPEVFRREQEVIFAAGWVWAGYEHWVPAPGDLRPVTVSGRPLLLVRDTHGAVRVFHNVCRHRGMRLVDEPGHVRRRVQCAYHCWSYELDGSLAVTPYVHRTRGNTPPADLASALGLLPVASATWAGLVLVHLGQDPEPVEDLLAPLAGRWAPIDFGRLALAGERRFDVAANWKLVVENFLDFYHLPFVHPQVGPVASGLSVDDLVLSARIAGGCYPHGAAAKAAKTDGALPLLGEHAAGFGDRQDLICMFPNALLFLQADWYQVIAVDPVGPDRTVEHMAVFVDASGAGERFAPARAALCEVLFGVNEQDLPFLARLQAGRNSPGADHNHLLASWDQVTAVFQMMVRDALGESQ